MASSCLRTLVSATPVAPTLCLTSTTNPRHADTNPVVPRGVPIAASVSRGIPVTVSVSFSVSVSHGTLRASPCARVSGPQSLASPHVARASLSSCCSSRSASYSSLSVSDSPRSTRAVFCAVPCAVPCAATCPALPLAERKPSFARTATSPAPAARAAGALLRPRHPLTSLPLSASSAPPLLDPSSSFISSSDALRPGRAILAASNRPLSALAARASASDAGSSGDGEGSSGGRSSGGARSGGRQKIVPLYMDGWNVVRSIIDDLKAKRGFNLATEVLLSGSSAGGQATIYLCDRVAAAFPTATTRCVADSGYFVNSIDRNGTRLWERLAKSISTTQQLSNPACRKRLPPSRHWACFFPEQALMALKTPIFVIQSLFDVVAAAIGGQTRTTPDHNFYNYTATVQCVNELLDIPMPITIFVRSGTWRNVRYKTNYCKVGERTAMYNMAQLVYTGLERASKERQTRGVFLISNGMHGVALMDDRWVGTKVKGVSARDALTRWYNSRLNKIFFMHE